MTNEKNRRAFLDMIAVSEGTKGIGDDGYNVLVGSTRKEPKLFNGYETHPNQLERIDYIDRKTGQISNTVFSTAAGRYQILFRYWNSYRKILGLKDFSPAAQDAIALRMIIECNALADIDEGRILMAIRKCKSRWASFPAAGYNQHEQKVDTLLAAYAKAGGASVA